MGNPICIKNEKMPAAIASGDSCLDGGGGYSIKLSFWWHLAFPVKLVLRTLQYLPNNKDKKLISISILEFFTVIINYCAAVVVFETHVIMYDPHPIILNLTDNISALNWTMHASKDFLIGRRLARFFCFLLIDSPLGNNYKWLSTVENKMADDILRQKL